MTFVLAVCVAVCFGVSVYLLLGRELKGVAMGVFLIGHAANLSILAMSGSPVPETDEAHGQTAGALLKEAPLSSYNTPSPALDTMVDPLPQALILTAIVIGFAVMGFLLTLLVITARSTGTLELSELAKDAGDPPPTPDRDAAGLTPAGGGA
ncbi:MAG: sodium:proton antiporter [Planctomycetota bacterium]